MEESISMEKFPITSEGFKKMEAELNKLKAEERPRVIKDIAEARAHGDLSENAEYHAAREKQGFIEAKIADLESKVSRSQIIDVSTLSGNTVQFGATVKIVDEESDEESSYQIVSEYEADLNQKRISIGSPLARALMGREVGDSVELNTPKGTRYYEILSVSYK
jgi:transcription elongation factor GreA